jgi:glycogen phosphorylase
VSGAPLVAPGMLKTIAVEVFLNEVAPDDVRVKLYADPNVPDGDPARTGMERVGPLPATSHGFVFRARVSAGRPAGDWTARVIPASEGLLTGTPATRAERQRP